MYFTRHKDTEVMNLVLFISLTLLVPQSPVVHLTQCLVKPRHILYSLGDCTCNEKWIKNAWIKHSHIEVWTLAHAILHSWSTLASFLGFWSLSICHERINGAIIELFQLTFRVIGWQSRKGPLRQSPMLLMKSELLKRKPEAGFGKFPFIWNPNKQEMQMAKIFYL